MTFGFLILTIILSVIAALITLVIGIIKLATGKKRSGLILGVSFLMSLVILILCVMEVMTRATKKVESGIEWMKKLQPKNAHYEWNDEDSTTTFADSTSADTVKPAHARPIK